MKLQLIPFIRPRIIAETTVIISRNYKNTEMLYLLFTTKASDYERVGVRK